MCVCVHIAYGADENIQLLLCVSGGGLTRGQRIQQLLRSISCCGALGRDNWEIYGSDFATIAIVI